MENIIELRDQVTTGIKKVVDQIRSVTNRITAEVQEKAGELKQLGQDLAVKQLDHLTKATKSIKKTIQKS